MADNIELVIKIPKEKYDAIKNNSFPEKMKECFGLDGPALEAIKNGIPLPKGHGRIADIDKVLEEMKVTRTYDIPFALERVKPIIEADREGREE